MDGTVRMFAIAAWLALAGGCATPGPAATTAALEAEVRATETAFAATMAARDFAAFRRFLAADAVFVSGPAPLRGSAAVSAAWQRYFAPPDAPFSWQPEQVVVLTGGELAFSSGPVLDPDGNEIGTFNSVWRREQDGRWRIVFDKGGCRCP